MNVGSITVMPVLAQAAQANGASQVAAAPSPPSPASAKSGAARPTKQPAVLPHLYIELDAPSGRFVQTVIDTANEAVLRRFPNEGQLAFARGVNAYMRALQTR